MSDLRCPTFIAFDCPKSLQSDHSLRRGQAHGRRPVKRRDLDIHDSYSRSIEIHLISLCRTKQWDHVLVRCKTHPHETVPVLMENASQYVTGSPSPLKRDRKNELEGASKESIMPPLIYEQTALGFVCASSEIPPDTKLKLIRTLYTTSPTQLIASQKMKGCTPLRDLIVHCHSCTVSHLVALLETDEASIAVQNQDMNGLTPVDHLVMRLHLDPCSTNVYLFRCYVDMVERDLRGSPNSPNSPMIRLLSLASNQHQPLNQDNTAFNAILDATKYLLQNNPSRINDVSKSSGCTVLHVALRNFGDQPSLIQLLLDASDSSILTKRNVFGDLPLHVACAGGSPMEVLRLILTKSLQAIPPPTDGPHPLLWSTNRSGYTPVDLEWMRHIEGGGGLYESRTFYPLEERGMHCTSPRQVGLYQSLLRKTVGQVMTGQRGTCFFGALLDRIVLIVQMAYNSDMKEENLLHAAAALSGTDGPDLPQPLLFLFHWMCNGKASVCDEKGRLPLHYALTNHRQNIKRKVNESDSFEVEEHAWVDMLIESFPQGTRIADKTLRLPLHYALDSPCFPPTVVNKLTLHHPESLERRDPVSGLYPFQQAAISDLDMCFYLLRRGPNLISSGISSNS